MKLDLVDRTQAVIPRRHDHFLQAAHALIINKLRRDDQIRGLEQDFRRIFGWLAGIGGTLDLRRHGIIRV